MEKRSRRRTRDLVTQAASQGLSENEIGCARISMMARSTNAPCKGRIQMRKTNTLQNSHLACNARPVHTDGSRAALSATDVGLSISALPRKRPRCAAVQNVAKGQFRTHAAQQIAPYDQPVDAGEHGLIRATPPYEDLQSADASLIVHPVRSTQIL